MGEAGTPELKQQVSVTERCVLDLGSWCEVTTWWHCRLNCPGKSKGSLKCFERQKEDLILLLRWKGKRGEGKKGWGTEKLKGASQVGRTVLHGVTLWPSPHPTPVQIFHQGYQSERVCCESGLDWKGMKELVGKGKSRPASILRSRGWTNSKINTRQINRRKTKFSFCACRSHRNGI